MKWHREFMLQVGYGLGNMPVEIGNGAHIDSLIGGDEGQEIYSATPEDYFFGEYTVISFQILMKRMDKSAIYGDMLPSTTAICRQQCHVSGKKASVAIYGEPCYPQLYLGAPLPNLCNHVITISHTTRIGRSRAQLQQVGQHDDSALHLLRGPANGWGPTPVGCHMRRSRGLRSPKPTWGAPNEKPHLLTHK